MSQRPFLQLPGNLCFALNIDWFNPYDETPYSAGAISLVPRLFFPLPRKEPGYEATGAIYLVVLNLPRCERYKVENTILVGMIPGPNEPKDHMNTYLSPLVEDMCKLYDGYEFYNPSSMTTKTTIRAMIACITCDLTATRKVCGFSNFNATLGCSKCLKQFTVDEFNIVRYHVIDPMHNVFLGLVKHTVKTWKDTGLLLERHFQTLQEKVDSMNAPSKIGHIPRKIGSGFAAFTADEWKHWVLIYSVYALHGILPEDHYRCWCTLVDSCRYLCQPVTTFTTIERAHDLIVEFCKTFEALYGHQRCTPNMHMTCHLASCIKDYRLWPFVKFLVFSI